MPTSDYFRCPSCRAKLKFGSRPKSRVTCPRCGHQFDYQPTSEGSESLAQRGVEPNSDAHASASASEEQGTTAAFGFALQEVAGSASDSGAQEELDLIEDEAVAVTPSAKGDDEYGSAAAPIRPRTIAAPRNESEPSQRTQRPLSKRLKKWYKRSWLSNPSTGGWQIAAGYAAIGVVVMVTFVFMWMRYLQSEAGSDRGSSYATVYNDSSSNVSRLGITGVLSLATLFCLPVPYGLWVGSHVGRYAWLFARGVGYIACLVMLPGFLSNSSHAVVVVPMALLAATALSNLVGCVLLTTWEGSVGRTLFAIVPIVGSELVFLILILTTGFPIHRN